MVIKEIDILMITDKKLDDYFPASHVYVPHIDWIEIKMVAEFFFISEAIQNQQN